MLSIITICYNNLHGLKRTISSIDYDLPVEHIIIDGASTDGVQDYLKTLKISNLQWVSEPDHGIYDAMNKGLYLVKGDYIIYMNAGDLFFDNKTITALIEIVSTEAPDVLYGDAMYINEIGKPLGLRSKITTRPLPKSLHWTDMKDGMLVCHQSFVVRRSLAPKYILNNLSADIDWQIKCLKTAKKIKYFETPLCQYLIGGTSQQHHFKSLTDRFKIMSSHYGLIPTTWYHVLIVLRALKFRFT